MKKVLFFLAFVTLCGTAINAQQSDNQDVVRFVIHTDFGDMEGYLFNDTPKHRDNFVKLANEGWYKDSPFHRVIKDFMIQGGGNSDGRPDPGYKIDAEILPQHSHIKGALAAARQGDNMNPLKKSSGSQFYVVQGRAITAEQVDLLVERKNMGVDQKVMMEILKRPENSEKNKQVYGCQSRGTFDSIPIILAPLFPELERIKKERGLGFNYSPEQRAAMVKNGATPHLDGDYTVFGQITKGLEVIDIIANQPTAGRDKPVSDIKMDIEILD